MANIGQMNYLTVVKHVDFGVYLDAGLLGEVLLPKKEVPEGCEPGNELEVFLYYDSDDRPIASTTRPKALVGECAFLECVAVNQTGAFLDWGLLKDLMVPFGEQAKRMQTGKHYMVFVYINERDDRIAASSKLDTRLKSRSPWHKVGQEVELNVYDRTDLGFKCVVDHFYLGLLFHSDAIIPLQIGQPAKGFIKSIRKDGRMDLCLRPDGGKPPQDITEQVIAHLIANGGRTTISDKSPPDVIFRTFGISKAAYKRVLGTMLRKKLVALSPDSVTLVTHE